jgi:uncharacterized protein (TIGR02271 family)
MLTTEQIDRLLSQGANVLSRDGEKIGSISQVFVDNDEGQPRWATVKTGLFGMSESFVPLDGARTEGDDLLVPYSKDHVKDAPRIDADRPLEPAEEDRLYQHYQLDRDRTHTEASAATADFSAAPVGARDDTAPTMQRDDAETDRTTTPTTQRDDAETDRTTAPTGSAGYDTTTPPATAGYDTTAPTGSAAPAATAGYESTPPATAGYDTTAQRDDSDTDRTSARDTTVPTAVPTAADTTTRPEKRADVGAEQPATGRARLRKYVTTENVTRTVPVQREEVRIEREPITQENRDEVLDQADKGDEGDVILHEERIIVTKETVPVERIHIGTETVTDEVTINEEVRKEHLDTEGPDGTEESRR